MDLGLPLPVIEPQDVRGSNFAPDTHSVLRNGGSTCLLVIVIIMSLINSKRGRLLKESAEEKNTSKSVVRREVIAQVLRSTLLYP